MCSSDLADSKRRREVTFDDGLRTRTVQAATELHAMLESGRTPPAHFRPRCEECSLFDLCLPKATGAGEVQGARLRSALFDPALGGGR